MVDTEAQRRVGGLLFGPGPRARDVAAVLAALAGLPTRSEGSSGSDDPGGDEGPAPTAVVPALLEDLEELLRERPGEGVLILESSRVPGQDIGFIRRFLERHPGWTLAVLCEDLQEPRSQELAGLLQATVLTWPPDLESLRALLGPQHRPRQRDVGQRDVEPRESRREMPRGRRGGPNGSEAPAQRTERVAPKAGTLDLGLLVEEILASTALRGEGAPRYQFRCDAPVLVDRVREPLVEGLSGLLELARRCAGPEGLVRAAVIPGAEGPRVGLEFPLGELPEKDLPRFLEAAFPADGDEGLGQGIQAAKHGVDLLRGLGGQVEFAAIDGRVRCEVHLTRPRGPGKTPAGRTGKPEDPFA